MSEDAPQREHRLREVFNALRWIVRSGSPLRLLPNDFPPWEAVYQQSRCWLDASRLEAMVMDLRLMIRFACGRQAPPPGADTAGIPKDFVTLNAASVVRLT